MSDVCYLRPINPPATPAQVHAASKAAGGCLNLHGVDLAYSFLAADGGRMLCWYRAPDAESVRLALRQLGSDMNAVWPCTLIGQEGPATPRLAQVNTVAEATLGDAAAAGESGWPERLAPLLRSDSGATLVLGFLSSARTRLFGLFDSADVSQVRSALAHVGLHHSSVWPCSVVTPEGPVR